MGSSEASATCLRAVLRVKSLEVVGVVTQPDRPAGRGKVLSQCPCKAAALSYGLTEIISPENVNSEEAMSRIRAWAPDAVAVVAFGQFLREPLLNLPRFGCINCHFSLLPKYRGASPVAAAIEHGDKLTGVSVMKMGIGMDDGPVMLQGYQPILKDHTSGTLMEDLAILGGVRLAKVLALLAAGEEVPLHEQNHAEATFAHKLKKTDALIDWSEPVIAVDRRIRAYSPWPLAYTFLPERFRKKGNSGRVNVYAAEIISTKDKGWDETWREAKPGTILKIVRPSFERDPRTGEKVRELPSGPVVKCADTALMLTQVKPDGGQLMSGGAFVASRSFAIGEDVLADS